MLIARASPAAQIAGGLHRLFLRAGTGDGFSQLFSEFSLITKVRHHFLSFFSSKYPGTSVMLNLPGMAHRLL
jgi:hypothetical protein